MKKNLIVLALLSATCLAALLLIQSAAAQVQGGWPPPHQLSSPARKASEGSIVADRYGYVHIFWTEELPNDQAALQYARFDGETWSAPVDIHITKPFVPIEAITPVLDGQGTLHLLWAEGDNGPVYYSRAPAHAALSARQWEKPDRLQIPTRSVALKVDSQGVLHVLYQVTSNTYTAPGTYYIRSEDQGVSWSNPVWLDQDIPANYVPGGLQFALGENDILHALWVHTNSLGLGNDRIRYTRSLDRGTSWLPAMTLAENGEGSTMFTHFGTPLLIAQDQTVHLIWIAGELIYRNHRFSTDSGESWSTPARILGDLDGQAGDGLAIDSAGRLHYFAQIRYPQGIYHASWYQGEWNDPEMVYFMRNSASDSIPADIVLAHETKPTVRLGNQLVLTFSDSPGLADTEILVIDRMVEDAPALAAMPTPLPTPQPSPTPSPTPPRPIPTATIPTFDIPVDASSGLAATSGIPVWLGALSTLVVLGGTIAFRLLSGNKRP